MKVIIDIPEDFTGDYITDKFKDFFLRVIADVDCKGVCGRYEKEIAEMFLKAFDDSKEKTSCNCQHNSNSRDNQPCCRCNSRKTNADRIRSMTDEELAVNMMCPNENGLAEIDCDKNDNCNCYECLLKWLRAESEE